MVPDPEQPPAKALDEAATTHAQKQADLYKQIDDAVAQAASELHADRLDANVRTNGQPPTARTEPSPPAEDHP